MLPQQRVRQRAPQLNGGKGRCDNEFHSLASFIPRPYSPHRAAVQHAALQPATPRGLQAVGVGKLHGVLGAVRRRTNLLTPHGLGTAQIRREKLRRGGAQGGEELQRAGVQGRGELRMG